MRNPLLSILFVCLPFTSGGLAQDPKKAEDYLRLTFEAKGRLKVRLDPKNGEVVDGTLSVRTIGLSEESWHLYFVDLKGLKESAKKLDGQTVVVTGEFLTGFAEEVRSTKTLRRRSFDHAALKIKTIKVAEP
jgi:hypothetical protein